MFVKILFNKNLELKNRIKRANLYYIEKTKAKKNFKKRFKDTFSINREYQNTTIESVVERKHVALWKFFDSRMNRDTFRLCENISGRSAAEYVPEEIFTADIELSLNKEEVIKFFELKSFYNRWHKKGLFPKDFLHCIDGQIFNDRHEEISLKQIDSILDAADYPLICKPNIHGYGGKDVVVAENPKGVKKVVSNSEDVVVQELIQQHPFFSAFNPHGLNTIRICIYKSVKDHQFHVLNMAMRMGRGGSLDNLTDGGIVTLIRNDGFLNGFAFDKYGTKFEKHPDTNISFAGQIPDLEGLTGTAHEIVKNIPYAKLFSLDMCYDNNSNWRVIEVNLTGQTIRFAQYSGVPFFGEFTNEVIEYCKTNHWALQ